MDIAALYVIRSASHAALAITQGRKHLVCSHLPGMVAVGDVIKSRVRILLLVGKGCSPQYKAHLLVIVYLPWLILDLVAG